jgi:hypothetical protein
MDGMLSKNQLKSGHYERGRKIVVDFSTITSKSIENGRLEVENSTIMRLAGVATDWCCDRLVL